MSVGEAGVVVQSDRIVRAARVAIERAKRRGSPEVTPDDLLLGLLREASRFGVALIGDWAIDVDALAGEAGDGLHPASAGPPPAGDPRPAYAPETAAIFDRAAGLAREDGSAVVGLVHLLAAYGYQDGGLMARLRAAHGITPAGWRAALARWDGPNGTVPAIAAEAGPGEAAGRRGELLTIDDAAAILAVHPQTVRHYVRTGKLPAYRLAGERVIRIRREDLLALLEPVHPDDAELPG